MDLEAEYNNRARVPEHPQIFARWEQDGAAYRAEAAAEGRAEIGLKYGPSRRQTIDLFHPAAGGAAPLSLFIHGGYWRSLEPSSFSHMSRGLNARGVTVAVAGYDLCPQVTIGEIIGQMRQACLYLWRRFGRRLLVHGHSAGGHLAACMAATDWKVEDDGAPDNLVPAGFALSGLFDLLPLTKVAMNAELRMTEADARAFSPLYWPAPFGSAFDAWCGSEESSEFRRQNRIIAETWGRQGVSAHSREVAGTNHFTVVDPMTDPNSAMVDRLVALAQRT